MDFYYIQVHISASVFLESLLGNRYFKLVAGFRIILVFLLDAKKLNFAQIVIILMSKVR